MPQRTADQRLTVDVEQVKCIDANLHLYVTLTGILDQQTANMLIQLLNNLKSVRIKHLNCNCHYPSDPEVCQFTLGFPAHARS